MNPIGRFLDWLLTDDDVARFVLLLALLVAVFVFALVAWTVL